MRDNGLYIVKLDGKWTVAEWDGSDWSIIGDEDWLEDDDFDAIGDKVQLPAEEEGGE